MLQAKVVENIKTRFRFNNVLSKILPCMRYSEKNIYSRTQMTVWRLRIACWKLKVTNTHSEYVKRITFPLQQYLESDRPQMTVWRMRFACWIPKATNTHSEYVKRIVFPLQQLLHERTSVLRYTYIPCPVWIMIINSIMKLSAVRT
jgi:hypothetical protein